MASITIRDLDDEVKTRLWVRAAEHHRSTTEEARFILRDAVGRKSGYRDLAGITRAWFGTARPKLFLSSTSSANDLRIPALITAAAR